MPNVRSDASLPKFAIWSVGAYYAVLFTSLACGFASIMRGRVDGRWLIPALLIVGFAGVHLLYWSDARMRAPVTPAIALLAALGVQGLLAANGKQPPHDPQRQAATTAS